MLLKVTWKILLDHNARYSSIRRIHGYCYCSPCIQLLLLLLYCTVTIIVSFQYSSNMDIDWLTELYNNINEQLILGLKKLMEETMSVFWVDLGYRLHSWNMLPMQSSRGWLTSHMFIVLQCYCKYYSTVILWVLLLLLTTWR